MESKDDENASVEVAEKTNSVVDEADCCSVADKESFANELNLMSSNSVTRDESPKIFEPTDDTEKSEQPPETEDNKPSDDIDEKVKNEKEQKLEEPEITEVETTNDVGSIENNHQTTEASKVENPEVEEVEEESVKNVKSPEKETEDCEKVEDPVADEAITDKEEEKPEVEEEKSSNAEESKNAEEEKLVSESNDEAKEISKIESTAEPEPVDDKQKDDCVEPEQKIEDLEPEKSQETALQDVAEPCNGEKDAPSISVEEKDEILDNQEEERAEAEKSEDKGSPSDDKEESELVIVETPTVDVDNEEDLPAETVLPTEIKSQENVAKWVRNSAKIERKVSQDDNEDEYEYSYFLPARRGRKRKSAVRTQSMPIIGTRKSQRVISNSLKRSSQSVNRMHSMDNGGNDTDGYMRKSLDENEESKISERRQNGRALAEETATISADNARGVSIKKEPIHESDLEGMRLSGQNNVSNQKSGLRGVKQDRSQREEKLGKKRPSSDEIETSSVKRICTDQREQYIMSVVDCDNVDRDELDAKSEQMRAELKALTELLRTKEMEWNEILSLKKLKEEAYDRLQRKRQVMSFIDSNGPQQQLDALASSTIIEWDSGASRGDKRDFSLVKNDSRNRSRDSSPFVKKDEISRQVTPPKQFLEAAKKQMMLSDAQNFDNRQIGEGRQGPIVDVRSIIADYRLKHPESVPRRGRRLRNSVNINLGAGGAVVENVQSIDSRPSSTDSCKSNPNISDPNNSMSFRDVLVQFAKLSQQQGEPVKTPQNYPDVTLHPVAPSPVNVTQSGASAHSQPSSQSQPQQTTSLLHGILTKTQSPRLTTFSPTLARLLTAPERDRTVTTVTPAPSQASQHLLQTYQGSNPVSISELLSSSKARTEITITPVVNPSVQSHSNNLIQVDDGEEETTILEERDCRVTNVRDHRDDRESPPRCQGCLERAAQFVCAGCGNQWYCSRECQVSAWDEHSEVCSG